MSSPYDDLLMLPCYSWQRSVVVPHDHPLTKLEKPTLTELAAYPLITYPQRGGGESKLDEAFRAQGLTPNLALTAADSDVIKNYVRLGMGVGVLASMAMDGADNSLRVLDVTGLFKPSISYILLRKEHLYSEHIFYFIENFAPHLSKALIEKALLAQSQAEVDQLFDGVTLPSYVTASKERAPFYYNYDI